MVEINEITDEASLNAWFEGQPGNLPLELALRACLRSVMLMWGWSLGKKAETLDWTATPVLRSALIMSVVCRRRNQATVKAARSQSTRSADDATHFATVDTAVTKICTALTYGLNCGYRRNDWGDAATSCNYAIEAARNFTRAQWGLRGIPEGRSSLHDRISGGAADETALLNFDDEIVVEETSYSWARIREDCQASHSGASNVSLRMWDLKDPLEFVWQRHKQRVLSAYNWQPGNWSFWVNWYEQMLDPVANRPNWDLLEQVARIDQEIWDAGPEAVSAEIKAIELAFSERALSTGEQFYYDAADQIFRRAPVASGDEPVLKYCIDRLAELDALAQTMGNMQGVLGAELFFVRRAVEHHADNPVMVWDNCGNALSMLQGNLASGACPADEPFVTILKSTLTDVRGRLDAEPAVQYVSPHRPTSAPVDDEQALDDMAQAGAELVALVEPEVAEEIAHDIRTMRDRFTSAAQRSFAFITTAGRVLSVFMAACAKGVMTTLDGVVAVTDRIEQISKHCAGTAANLAKISAGLGAPLVAVLNAEKIPAAIEWITRLFL